MHEHLEAYQGEFLEIKSGVKVSAINPVKSADADHGTSNFKIETKSGDAFESKTVLIASGSARRKLTIPGAEEFEQKGITYCASCDGPLFADQAVAVIGGGNAGAETAAQLAAYCQSVTLLHHGENFKADAVTIEKLRQNPKVTLLTQADIQEVKGQSFVNALIYKDLKTGENKELKVTGIFVEVGAIPATDFVKDLVDLNQIGAIKVDPRNQRASVAGLWAAGDCTDGLYHQNNIAAGDAVKALEDIYNYLHLGK